MRVLWRLIQRRFDGRWKILVMIKTEAAGYAVDLIIHLMACSSLNLNGGYIFHFDGLIKMN